MQISVSRGNNTNFMAKDVADISDVAKAALEYNVSTGIFTNNYRTINNFKSANFVGLDIDEGMTIDEAKVAFKEYTHAILPSRNHQKDKNGKTCDRFRVFLQLEAAIDNEKDFYETWSSLKDRFPAVDPQTKDPSRQFYACTSIAQVATGKLVPVKRWVKRETKTVELPKGTKGQLAKGTLAFLTLGAKSGSRRNTLYKSLRDMYQNNYTPDECRDLVLPICIKLGIESDVDKTIDSAFSKEPRHEPRIGEEEVIEQKSFQPMTVDSLYKKKDTAIDWLLHDLLPMGGCSIIAGPPKAGKSTIIRQLCASIVMSNEKFLNRKVVNGKVLYLALEEQEGVLKQEYKRLGIKGKDFFIFVGGIDKATIVDDLKGFIIDNKISLVVIDTLMVFSAIENSNDYKETYAAMTVIRDLARETNCHIMCVHHTNKSEYQGTNSIMGSSAFLASVDVAIIFKALGDRRYITSVQRTGKAFDGEELHFDKVKHTYAISRKKEKDEQSNSF